MSRYFKDDFTEKIDEEISSVLDSMKSYGPDSKEYSQFLDQLERLKDLKRKERREPVNKNTWALIGANIFVTGMVLIWEHKHVITSRAFGNIIKPRN